jgi:hypothetical protein
MASDGSFTAISGSWTVPNASGVAGETTADATWIGIGGVTTSDLIQTGTQNTVNANGTQTSSGFYELLPGDSITVPNFIVSAGDVITANLTELAPSEWTITLSDTTTDITFTKTVTYDSSLSSAEWIEEDPSYSSYRQVPFDDFGTVNITSAATTENGTSLTMGASDAQEITMVDRDDLPVATPSAMGSDGESFSVTRNEGGA